MDQPKLHADPELLYVYILNNRDFMGQPYLARNSLNYEVQSYLRGTA
jgi:hypothetical protein